MLVPYPLNSCYPIFGLRILSPYSGRYGVSLQVGPLDSIPTLIGHLASVVKRGLHGQLLGLGTAPVLLHNPQAPSSPSTGYIYPTP